MWGCFLFFSLCQLSFHFTKHLNRRHTCCLCGSGSMSSHRTGAAGNLLPSPVPTQLCIASPQTQLLAVITRILGSLSESQIAKATKHGLNCWSSWQESLNCHSEVFSVFQRGQFSLSTLRFSFQLFAEGLCGQAEQMDRGPLYPQTMTNSLGQTQASWVSWTQRN